MRNIIGKRTVFLTLSAVLIIVSVAAIALFGFRQGVDFSGGTLWQFKADGVAQSDVEALFRDQLGFSDARIAYDISTGNFMARVPAMDEARHQGGLEKLRVAYPSFEELGYASIGPTVGADLKQKSIVAIVLVLLGISLYIAFAFRKVFRPISSWKYGWVTLFTLFHDVIIPAGLLAILGHFLHVEIDGNFVVALLVVMGFSVHDTIVVFDRIRENLFLDKGRGDFGTIVNTSVNQTMGRSINTSLTLILVLVALLILGPANLHYFVLTLLVGVITGIYSSIFVASPLLYIWQRART